MVEIKIILNDNGEVGITHPKNVLISLGLIELAKANLLKSVMGDSQPSNSGIIPIQGSLGFPKS